MCTQIKNKCYFPCIWWWWKNCCLLPQDKEYIDKYHKGKTYKELKYSPITKYTTPLLLRIDKEFDEFSLN